MKLSAEQKQLILSQYSARDRSHSYRALSRQFGISKDGRSIKRWAAQWDGTATRSWTSPYSYSAASAQLHQAASDGQQSSTPEYSLSKYSHSHQRRTQHTGVTENSASIWTRDKWNQAEEGEANNNTTAYAHRHSHVTPRSLVRVYSFLVMTLLECVTPYSV